MAGEKHVLHHGDILVKFITVDTVFVLPFQVRECWKADHPSSLLVPANLSLVQILLRLFNLCHKLNVCVLGVNESEYTPAEASQKVGCQSDDRPEWQNWDDLDLDFGR